MNKRILVALILLALLSSYKPQKIFLINKFTINEIIVENNLIIKDKDIKEKLSILYEKNLFTLNASKIENILKKIDLIKSFQIKKIYPNKIVIKIFEKTPIAILQYKKEKFYVSKEIDLISYSNLEIYNDLPIIFGNKVFFKELYENLKKINFPLNLIKRYYLYESKRWDLETQEILIRLPTEDYIESLKNFMILKKKDNYNHYKVFDYRIKNQLILK